MRQLLALAALCCFSEDGAAQATFKCADGAGRITYSNERCEKQGLKEAGAVRDRLTVVPIEAKPPAKSDKGEKSDKSDKSGEPPSPPVKPVNPITEKLSK